MYKYIRMRQYYEYRPPNPELIALIQVHQPGKSPAVKSERGPLPYSGQYITARGTALKRSCSGDGWTTGESKKPPENLIGALL